MSTILDTPTTAGRPRSRRPVARPRPATRRPPRRGTLAPQAPAPASGAEAFWVTDRGVAAPASAHRHHWAQTHHRWVGSR